jgi:uncharacterized protein with HEPN domain
VKRERDPREYLDHIVKAISHIAAWVAEGPDQFENDYRTRQALIRTLQELAESVKRLEPLVGKRYPEVPWREVGAFRNVIVHDYLGLKLSRIWEIASVRVPELKPYIERMLADLPPEGPS